MNFDISFDLETLALEPNAHILSIGAVKFDRQTGEILDRFYARMNPSVEQPGRVISSSTVSWWARQGEAARAAVFEHTEDCVSLPRAMFDFADFCTGVELIWQRGDRDALWLETAYGTNPWSFWQLRDQRTLTSLAPECVAPGEVAHNALTDAEKQAGDLVRVLQKLRAAGVTEL